RAGRRDERHARRPGRHRCDGGQVHERRLLPGRRKERRKREGGKERDAERRHLRKLLHLHRDRRRLLRQGGCPPVLRSEEPGGLRGTGGPDRIRRERRGQQRRDRGIRDNRGRQGG